MRFVLIETASGRAERASFGQSPALVRDGHPSGTGRALVIFPAGGLGNRLRATSSAHILAEITGRQLFLNWIPDPTCGARWDELFENPFPAFPADMAELQAASSLVVDGPGGQLSQAAVQAMIEAERPTVAVMTGQQLWHPPCADFKDRKSAFYQSLVPVEAVREAVDEYRRRVNVSDMIGVHIRRGDLISDEGANPFDISPTGMFVRECARQLQSGAANGLFLSTDSPRDERALRRAFGPRLHSRPKVSLNRNAVDGIRDALIDWLLLSQTRFVIRSYFSSFSKEACVVRRIRSHVIYRRRPAPWRFVSDFLHRPRWKMAETMAAIGRIARRSFRLDR